MESLDALRASAQPFQVPQFDDFVDEVNYKKEYGKAFLQTTGTMKTGDLLNKGIKSLAKKAGKTLAKEGLNLSDDDLKDIATKFNKDPIELARDLANGKLSGKDLNLGNRLSNIKENLQQKASDVMDTIKGKVGDVANQAKGTLDQMKTKAGDVIKSGETKINQLSKDNFVDNFENIKDKLNERFKKLPQDSQDSIKRNYQRLSDKSQPNESESDIIDRKQGNLSKLQDLIGEEETSGKSFLGVLGDEANQRIGQIAPEINQTAEKAEQLAQKSLGGFKNTLSDTADNLADTAEKATSKVVSKGLGVGEKIEEGLEEATKISAVGDEDPFEAVATGVLGIGALIAGRFIHPHKEVNKAPPPPKQTYSNFSYQVGTS